MVSARSGFDGAHDGSDDGRSGDDEDRANQGTQRPAEAERVAGRNRREDEGDERADGDEPEDGGSRLFEFAETQRVATFEEDDGDGEGDQREESLFVEVFFRGKEWADCEAEAEEEENRGEAQLPGEPLGGDAEAED